MTVVVLYFLCMIIILHFATNEIKMLKTQLETYEPELPTGYMEALKENKMFKKLRDWKKLHCRVEELEKKVDQREAEKRILKDDIADLKHKKKLEDEDIKHLVKLTKEKQEVEFERKVIAAEKAKQDAIAVVKDEYRDKVEKQLSEQKDDIKGMYSEIMALVPKIKVGLKGEVG